MTPPNAADVPAGVTDLVIAFCTQHQLPEHCVTPITDGLLKALNANGDAFQYRRDLSNRIARLNQKMESPLSAVTALLEAVRPLIPANARPPAIDWAIRANSPDITLSSSRQKKLDVLKSECCDAYVTCGVGRISRAKNYSTGQTTPQAEIDSYRKTVAPKDFEIAWNENINFIRSSLKTTRPPNLDKNLVRFLNKMCEFDPEKATTIAKTVIEVYQEQLKETPLHTV